MHDDIADDIMNAKAVKKLHRQIAAMRAGTPNVGELQRLARKLGRKLLGGRGKEPQWVSRQFSELRPVSIPDHASMPRPTAQGIVDDLEGDLFAWERRLEKQEQEQVRRKP